MDEITEPVVEQAESSVDTDNTFDVPGELTVWEPGSSNAPPIDSETVPDDYILVKIDTPLQDKTYLLQVYDFETGLHPTPTDAVCVYLTETSLEIVYPVDSDTHLRVSRSLKSAAETVSREEGSVRDARAYNNSSQRVVWDAPKTDAAVIDE